MPKETARMASASLTVLLRRGAVTVAAARVALGLTALARPSVPARPWTGAGDDDLTARVLGRALGARDLALGLGALAALRDQAASPGPARSWVAVGALSDALDVAASLAAWRELPRVTRWLVAGSAGGAALAGAAGALAMRPERSFRGTRPGARDLIAVWGAWCFALAGLRGPGSRSSPNARRGVSGEG